MKFENLKQSLKEQILPAYLITGADSFLTARSVLLITQACNVTFPEMNYIKFDGDNIDFREVVRCLNTFPMMSEKKIVYVNFEIKNGQITNLPELKEYLANPVAESVLIINAGENGQVFGSLSGIEAVDCSKLSEKIIGAFITAELKKANKTINPLAQSLLIQYCLFDLAKIVSELNKLASFAGDRTEINEADVKENVNKSLEFQVFDLTENLAKRNSAQVFLILEQMKSKKENIKTITPLIYNHFRRLFHIAISNKSKQELSALLNVKEYAVTMGMRQASLFTKKQLKEINDMLINLDYEMKSGEITQEKSVDYLVLKILSL